MTAVGHYRAINALYYRKPAVRNLCLPLLAVGGDTLF